MTTEMAKVEEKDLTMAHNNMLNGVQLQHILKSTPKKYVLSRPAKGGGTWNYVSGGYIRKCLNLMFGWDWDFEILDEKILEDEVVVKGRLTCRSGDRTIIKTQYGNKDIIRRKADKKPISIGNDLKAAATDALKKCATEIGIAADVYNPKEFVPVVVEISDHAKAMN